MKIQIHKAIISSLCFIIPGIIFAGKIDTDLFNSIQARNDQYASYYNADDAASLAEMHTVDATVIAPNYGPSKGREAIKAGLEEELALGDGKLELETLEVSPITKKTVCEIGRYALEIVLEEGDPIVDEGHYVIIWQLGADNEWRLHVDMWNTSLPLD